MKTITSILAVLAFGTTMSFAADDAKKPKGDPEAAFKRLDANTDGKISMDEFKASPQAKKDEAKAMEMFGKKDKDGDKMLSMEEYTAGGKKK